ncbi:hypothetical protein IFR05_009375 [Cadophora sp. M221]|nr:hypothetical protein IFR05_009375 [Cadophora sp. M221]
MITLAQKQDLAPTAPAVRKVDSVATDLHRYLTQRAPSENQFSSILTESPQCGTNDVSPNDKCWSNCDAKAECGGYAKDPGQKCPLNVCCSQFGFCGMTEEFCKKTDDEETSCQSNCDQPGSGGSDGDVQSLIVGYYEAWNYAKNCIGMRWDDIPVNSLTHLNFAFGYITPGNFEITGMDDLSSDLFSDLTKLKSKNTALKTMVALGGWTFNDNNTVTQPVFSDMVSSEANRSKFIDNLFSFLRNYGFDGVDFDWEYPGAGDRGGQPEDGVNFSKFLKELQDRIANEPTKYIVSFTAPTSYWYLRHFDLEESVKHVDFVNVMSYDLHGIWDAENPIGSQVLAHTNLTEIKEALNLFWRNDIPPNKVNLGLGFYGRSFQLADPSCNTPGCLFKGGATAGPCTGNTGTLSYNEIMQVIEENNITPYHDKDNAVKYITWKGDQWISFDDQETFQTKIKFANDLGLGGLLIWAVDLDTPQLDALSGVIYPKRLGEIGAQASTVDKYKDASEDNCRVTECGTSSCRPGEVHITNQPCTRGDFVTGAYKISALCCPLASAPDPKTCSWRGNANFCNGQCHPGEVALESNKWGPDDGDAFFDECWDGLKFYCCEIPDKKKYNCGWTDCGETCDTSKQTKMTWAYQDCFLEPKEFCCDKEQKWENCAWHGKPGSCFDNHCDTGRQVALATSYDGEGDDCGWKFERKRTFCCDPPSDESVFSPVPLEYLFEHPPTGDTVDTDFDLELDPTYGGATTLPLAEDPNQAAFGFVVMASPEEIQVSLDKRSGSDWEVFNCTDSGSVDEHTVKMVCTDHSDQSDCYKIGLGKGVPGTIIEMPRGCGPGKYAVAISMTPAADQSMPHHLVKRGVPKATVYDLTFDYDFRRVPRDNANTQMRIDYSNEPGYWDKVVDEAARKKRKFKRELHEYAGDHKRWLDDAWMSDHMELKAGLITRDELHARWFGSDVVDWLKGLISSVAGGLDVKHSYTEDFKLIFLREQFTCDLPGNGQVQGKLDASATVHVEMDTNYGFTLVTTLNFPPDLSKSYLYFRNRGKVDAKFEMSAVVSASFQGETVLLSADQFGATFTVPGVMTIGPNFKLVGGIEGGLTLAGNFETQVKLIDWDVRQTFPVANNEWEPESDKTPNRDGTQQLRDPTFEYNVAVDGFITAHVKPTITFGVEWSKTLFDIPNAAVNLVADGYVTFYGQANTGSSGSSLCYGVQAGADLYANVDAPDLYGWKLSVDRYQIARVNPIDVYGPECPISSRGIDSSWLNLPGVNDTDADSRSTLLGNPRIFEDFDKASVLNKRAQPYGPVIRVPKLACPGQNDQPDDPYPCALCVQDSTAKLLMDREDTCIFLAGNPGESSCTDSVSKRDVLYGISGNITDLHGAEEHEYPHGLISRDSLLEKRTAKTIKWDYGGVTNNLDLGPYPSCNAAATGGGVSKYWTFDNPDENTKTCNTDVLKLDKNKVTPSEFQTDHVYEAQIVKEFMEMLRGRGSIPLPTGYTAASDQWVSTFLIGLGTPPVTPLVVENSPTLLVALSRNLGGNGNEGRLAILHKGINNKKGKMFSFDDFDYTQSGIRATKRYQREVAGVFLYMSDDVIWPKFTASSLAMETTFVAFDNTYQWGSQPGQEIGLGAGGRGAGRGLRDLYCWFIDQYMNRVELKYRSWSTQAKNALNNEPQGQGPEGQAWIDGAMSSGALRPSNMKFPSVGAMVPLGQPVTRSRYGAWDIGKGSPGPF